MNTPKIHILLSTYNGENYLKEQLDSIFQQSYQNFTLFIRDDGSSDQTPSLLAAYKEEHPELSEKIFLLPNPSEKNLGYMGSFWLLLEQCKGADYYAFCDQDDVWLPNKLEAGIQMLEKENPSMPLLYFSNYHYCDQALNLLHPAPAPALPITFRDVLFYTPAFGFSMIINESLRKMALKTADRTRLPHDGWMQKIAAAFGKILYDETSTALYRRHAEAVTSSNAKLLSAISYWIRQDIFGSSMKETHFVLNRFFQEYGEALPSDDKKLLALYTGPTGAPLNWFRRFSYKKRLRPSIGGDLALRICFLLNTY